MKRFCLLGLGWLLLTAAGPTPQLNPPRPRLGEPFVASYPLPEPGLRLTGLRRSPLELLAPPHTKDGELRLYLVAMRPGPVRIPTLLLESQTGTRVETAAVELQVASGLASDSAIAPFKSLPSPPPAPASRWWPLCFLLLLAGSLALPLLRRRLRRPQTGPPGDAEELLLTRLQRQLEAAPGEEDPAWRQLHEELLRLRFAPGPRPPQAVAHLAEKIALQTGGAAP